MLIAGGASAIGGATTRALADAGAKVAFTYMTSADEAGTIEREYTSTSGQVLGLQANMMKPEGIAEVVQCTEQDFGPLDVLFVNSGGFLKGSRCIDATLQPWHEANSLDLLSTFLVVQGTLRSMDPRKSGSIVLMSSLAVFDGSGHGASHYATAKGPLATLVRSLAKEVGPLGIRVNGVAPGLIGTRFHDTFNTPQGRAESIAKTPLRREGTPQDLAGTVLYLASEQAAYVTGEVVQINGGIGF